MAGKAYVVTSGKGGVGKTTLTANLGAALALRGKRVCVIDTDIGLRNLDIIMGLENQAAGWVQLIIYTMLPVYPGYMIKRKKDILILTI